jgi:hypothetical protein
MVQQDAVYLSRALFQNACQSSEANISMMSPRYCQQIRQLLLISLMAFALVGVQLVQASPLHDHTGHTVDCALCHLQFTDVALEQYQPSFAWFASTVRFHQQTAAFLSSRNPSPYQGRAPPAVSR